jgi:hypothetical protein
MINAPTNQHLCHGANLTAVEKQQFYITDYARELWQIEVKTFSSPINLNEPNLVFCQYLRCIRLYLDEESDLMMGRELATFVGGIWEWYKVPNYVYLIWTMVPLAILFINGLYMEAGSVNDTLRLLLVLSTAPIIAFELVQLFLLQGLRIYLSQTGN